MNIGAVCNREVVIVQSNVSVLDAVILMRQFHVGHVEVINDAESQCIPIGLLSDHDVVVKLLATGLDLNVFTVGDIMETEVNTVDECSGVFETIQSMRHKGLRRLSVVNQSGGLVGIITLEELILFFANEFNNLTKLMINEQIKHNELAV